MRYKGLIITSTVLVFLMASVLAFVWLFKVRYVEVDVFAEVSETEETYEYVNGLLEDRYFGKSFFSFNEKDVKNTLIENPYIKIKRIKKVFPDRIQVSVEKRVERFALYYNSVYYITDSDYFILRKVTDKNLVKEGIIEMKLDGIDLDESSLAVGSALGYHNADIVGYMTAVFSDFSDGLNLVNNVTLMGRQNWIRFYTKTGVCIEFSFAKSNPTISDEQRKTEAEAIIKKVAKVEEFYVNLNEKEKSEGFILVYTKSSGEITIEHDYHKVEV